MAPLIVRTPPHASSASLTLDLVEKQVLIRFGADQFLWHQRLLLLRVSGAVWIVGTPTLEVEQANLSNERVLPLTRYSPFPEDERPYFCFGALSGAEIDSLRNKANALAEILGVEGGPSQTPTGGAIALWRYADPAHSLFGQVVVGSITSSAATFESRESIALVLSDPGGGTGSFWTVAERVLPEDMEEWTREKRIGAGRDPRLAGPSRREGVFSLLSATLEGRI